ncbi:MAG TPA: OsmC family protein [Polyangiales bacterium]|nr:OsmC family protein [Polyangiales bacterium]
MVDIYVHYEGGLHCTAKHGPSDSTFATDAPVDNHGRGESFSPTDLVATALGTCMVTTMGIAALKENWVLDGIGVHVKKEMTKELPRKIARLPTVMSVPNAIASDLDAAARAKLENIAHNCPVRLSLHPTIEVPITFRWGS